MKNVLLKLDLILLLILVHYSMHAHDRTPYNHSFDSYFQQAYYEYSNIPKGILEVVAWCNTRINNIDTSNVHSCITIPKAVGVMGLILDGKNYFNNFQCPDIIHFTAGWEKNPATNISAYALALSSKITSVNFSESELYQTLLNMSSLPEGTLGMNFARDAEVYQILLTLNNKDFMNEFGYSPISIDLKKLFGSTNYNVLSSKKVFMSSSHVWNKSGQYNSLHTPAACYDFPGAIWVAADISNYSSRAGTAISAITIHDIEGTYAGAISWFQNPASNVSAHYVLRSSDGQVTQMVCESDKAWHVGSENPYTIGFEHEGYAGTPGWFTPTMMQSSANISKDICTDYGINPLRTYSGPPCSGSSASCQLGGCIKIKGHQHYPNQTHTDPGIYWDWEYYYQLINNTPFINNYSSVTGTLYDSGGASANYSDDERTLYLIQPVNVTSITLNVSAFDLETNWDYLYIYDGDNLQAPLIGQYTGTTIPSTITSTGNTILLEFRSDCATTAAGWAINWTSAPLPPIANFTSVSNPICKGDSIYFINTSTFATTYSWLFVGGTPSTGTSANPGVVYDSSGTYPVTLVSSNSAGTDSITQNITVTIYDSTLASFTTIDTLLYLPFAIATFTNQSSGASSYIWDMGDSSTTTDVNPWHNYTAVGIYDIQLIALNPICPADTIILQQLISVLSPIGVTSNNSSSNVQIFPNPTNDLLFIDFGKSSTEEKQVTINDITGKLVFSTTANQTFFKLDVSSLAAGTYILKWISNQSSGIKQITIH